MYRYYRVTAVKQLSNNIRYPMGFKTNEFNIHSYQNDAIEWANTLAKKQCETNTKEYDIIKCNLNDSLVDGPIYQLKVLNLRRDTVLEINVFCIDVDNYITKYRGFEYSDKTGEVCSSGFTFATCVDISEAFMFIDSFLFACSLQQKE